MIALPYLLLCTTLLTRWALAGKKRWGWYLDLCTVAPWVAFYVRAEAWPLLAVPVVFGLLDVVALKGAWR